jgi:metallo-beta-lactamase class B
MDPLDQTRRVWLYLPPDYESSGRAYPVLYMHDGQNLFDDATSYAGEWGVDETLDSLHAAGDPGIIVVGIDNGGETRADEYSPWRNERLNSGGKGDLYVQFLTETLKPHIDSLYRTQPGPSTTGVMGSSMGGLISLHAMAQARDVFGAAGVFSPAFWFAPEIFDIAEAMEPDSFTRIYMMTGAQESANGERDSVYVEDHERMAATLTHAGFKRGKHLRALVREDGRHAEWFWRREFAAAYAWMF